MGGLNGISIAERTAKKMERCLLVYWQMMGDRSEVK
jgi:hypothetical protein